MSPRLRLESEFVHLGRLFHVAQLALAHFEVEGMECHERFHALDHVVKEARSKGNVPESSLFLLRDYYRDRRVSSYFRCIEVKRGIQNIGAARATVKLMLELL